MMALAVREVLARYSEDSQNTREKGDRFERLIKTFLKTDPVYADLFEEVWLWMEWPDRAGRPDTGIDLVAIERATGDHWAIQAKFYDPTSYLDKSDIDSFFTESGKKPFRYRMIVSTTDHWTTHAQSAMDSQQIPVIRLGIRELEESSFDWAAVDLDRPEAIPQKPKKKLRPHQVIALQDVEEGFKSSDRGKLIMACGTGKTFTALKIAEHLVPEGGNVLFLVPSISLISQSLTEWAVESERKLHCFAVCSDAKAGRKSENEDYSVRDLAFPAHTNSAQLKRQYECSKRVSPTGLNVIFSTYHSIAVLHEAQEKGMPEFDLIVCDEAHRTTGVEQGEKEESPFKRVHDVGYVKSKKRLYMTATPRIYSESTKVKAKEADADLFSMDDESLYGRELHRLDFSEAVRKPIVPSGSPSTCRSCDASCGMVKTSAAGLTSGSPTASELTLPAALTYCSISVAFTPRTSATLSNP